MNSQSLMTLQFSPGLPLAAWIFRLLKTETDCTKWHHMCDRKCLPVGGVWGPMKASTAHACHSILYNLTLNSASQTGLSTSLGSAQPPCSMPSESESSPSGTHSQGELSQLTLGAHSPSSKPKIGDGTLVSGIARIS